MARGRHIAVLLVALLVAVALPTAAIAQSAGEDQYTDPLQGGAGGGNGGGSGGGSGGGGSSGGGGGGNAPTTQAQSGTAPADTATPAQADDGSGGGLPNTGFPIAILLGSGLILLSAGLALRRTA